MRGGGTIIRSIIRYIGARIEITVNGVSNSGNKNNVILIVFEIYYATGKNYKL